MITDVDKACEAMLNKAILGIEVSEEEIVIVLQNGELVISGDDFEMHAYLQDTQ